MCVPENYVEAMRSVVRHEMESVIRHEMESVIPNILKQCLQAQAPSSPTWKSGAPGTPWKFGAPCTPFKPGAPGTPRFDAPGTPATLRPQPWYVEAELAAKALKQEIL